MKAVVCPVKVTCTRLDFLGCFSTFLAQTRNYSLPETIRGMGASFRRNDFWDRLGGQALPMIGYWLPWIP